LVIFQIRLFNMLGRAKKVTIEKENTTIVNGAGKKATSDYDRSSTLARPWGAERPRRVITPISTTASPRVRSSAYSTWPTMSR
jgi:hypothetical protein